MYLTQVVCLISDICTLCMQWMLCGEAGIASVVVLRRSVTALAFLYCLVFLALRA